MRGRERAPADGPVEPHLSHQALDRAVDDRSVRVGPCPDRTGWSAAYEWTAGCCYENWPPADRDMHGQGLLNEAANRMFMGADPQQVLREFAKIEAWRELRNVQFTSGEVDRAFMSGNPAWNPHNP